MLIKYKVIHNKKIIEDIIDAPDFDLAQEILLSKKFQIITMSEYKIKYTGRFLSNKDLAVFCSQLGVLVDAKLTLFQAVQSMRDSMPNATYLNGIVDDLSNGVSIYKSFENTHKFPPKIINSIKIGEASGNLPYILLKLSRYYTTFSTVKSKITTIAVYPVILVSVLICLCVGFSFYVLPIIKTLFKKDSKLPWITKFIFSLGTIPKQYFVYFGLIIAFLVILPMISDKANYVYTRILFYSLRSTFYYNYIQMDLLNSLLLLLGSGISMERVMYEMINSTSNRFVRGRLALASTRIKRGLGICESFRGLDILEGTALGLINAGEIGNSLDASLVQAVTMCELEITYKVDRLMAWVEPMSILIIGSIVSFILAAMMLPILNMSAYTNF